MKAPEELMAKVMNALAEKYKNSLILKGGMLLRLLNSPRATQDLDYCWIRTKKRDIFAQEIKATLEQLAGIVVTGIQANSRGIFLDILDQNSGEKTKLEINVEKSTYLPPKPLTNSGLTNLYSLKPQIIATMDLSEAFSHKIAASLERNLVRDLYDLMQFEPLTPFDETTLRARLSNLEINRAKPKKISLKEASKMLQDKISSLTQKKIVDELSAVFPREQIVGLDMLIRASVGRIIQRLESL